MTLESRLKRLKKIEGLVGEERRNCSITNFIRYCLEGREKEFGDHYFLSAEQIATIRKLNIPNKTDDNKQDSAMGL